jgi:hypothetical protein
MILKRLLAGLLGIAFIAGVVYLGFLSGRDPAFVIWFGIASAVLAPIGLALAGYAMTPGNQDVIQRLARVPEIERLVEEAKTAEERVRLLEAERARLIDVVQLESRRRAIKDRKESLERDAVRALDELRALDEEERTLGEKIQASPVQEAIQQLHERVKARQSGDPVLRIGSRSYRIHRDLILGITPFGLGRVILAYLRFLESVAERRRKRSAGA